MAGTDVGLPFLFPGFSLHDELALLVEAGLTPLEVLQAATRIAAVVANGRLLERPELDALLQAAARAATPEASPTP